jgi:hypothetical protein
MSSGRVFDLRESSMLFSSDASPANVVKGYGLFASSKPSGESPTAVRSHGRFVIIGLALRRKAGEGYVGRCVNASGAD